MNRCFQNTVVHVNLTNGEISYEHPGEEFYRKYGGGSAMGLFYLMQGIREKVDALSPENMLTFFTGLPTGLAISGQSRLTINGISPLSGAIGDSQSGGFFPAGLKLAGFDGVVVTGASSEPVFLLLDSGKAALRPAEHIWGKTTAEVDEILKGELEDPKIEILQIGPSGEKLVRLASIMNMSNRANGRTGLGAVMGSKKLKAVVVRGKVPIGASDAQTISRMHREGTRNIANNIDMDSLGKNGTADVIPSQNLTGTLPSNNYNEGTFKDFEDLSGGRMSDTILIKRDTCYACSVRCKRVVRTDYRGEPVLPEYGGPEYETLATLGTYCGISDLKAVSLASQICNMYGLDTIGSGATIAFAMECYENGLLTLEDTDGVELRFGNAEAMLVTLKNLALRVGFGDILAEGSARAAEKIGGNSADYLVTVKNTEAPAHMPQAKKSLGLIYAVNPFGADHQSSEHDPMYEVGCSSLQASRLASLGLNEPQPAGTMNQEKIRFAYLTELLYSALDSYCLCQFVWGAAWVLYGPQETAEMLSAASGWDISVDEILLVGERRLNMMRMFNARMGLDRSADRLPRKFFKPLEGEGPTAGVALDEGELEIQKDTYYQIAGWDIPTGVPGLNKLADLGIEWAV